MEIEMNVPLNIFFNEVGEWTKKSKSLPRTVDAFVCNGTVVVNFSSPICSVVVTVASTSTGKVLCWEVYEMPGNVVINMLSESTGDYQIKLTSPQWCLCGNFSISHPNMSFSQLK